MHRSIVRCAAVVIAGLSVLTGACATKAKTRIASAPPPTESTPTTTSEAGITAATTPTAAPTAPGLTATARAEPIQLPPAVRGGCSVVCTEANKGRIAPDDEARLSAALGGVVQEIRQCPGGDPPPPLTLRFNSESTLTFFGIDAEEKGDGECLDVMRQKRPPLTYQGPAIVRCIERCPL